MIKDVKNEKIMCKFCESLNYEKQYARESNRNRDKEDKLKHSYNVALITHTWTKRRGKRKACRTVDYRNQGIGYQLNYCPECGRMLKREMKSKDKRCKSMMEMDIKKQKKAYNYSKEREY
jgi:hypothetical protein